MTTHATYKNNAWIAIAILLLISIATAAITALLVIYFTAIKTFIPILVASVCLLGIISCYLPVRKHPTKRKRREMIVLVSNYLVIVLSSILYSIGFFWTVAVFFFLFVIVTLNYHLAHNIPSLLFLSANTIFSMSMSATFNGLMYARNISADWGTLYLTLLGGITFAALGFLTSTIALFSTKNKQQHI